MSVVDTGARMEPSAATEIVPAAPLGSVGAARVPYPALLIVGLGGLFAGVTGPLLSAFVPPLVRDALGDHRTAIGAVMAIDNFLLLLLVPLAGVASDRATARGRGRLPIVLGGFVLAAAGMSLFPSVGEARDHRHHRRDRLAVFRNQPPAIALSGTHRRRRAVALSLARDRDP